MSTIISQEKLKELVDYSPLTGIFTWRKHNKTAPVVAGGIAGSIDAKGYRRIMLDGRQYAASGLAFLYMEGKYKTRVHIRNGLKHDLRWENLTVFKHVPLGNTTQEILKEFFTYNPITGIFIRKVSTNSQSLEGTIAGGVNRNGYIVISVGKNRHYAHRLAWLYMTGEFPTNLIDHKDRNPGNNIWENLRECTPSQNSCNRIIRDNHPTGVKGVFLKNGKYRAEVKINNVVHKRSFNTLAEASIYVKQLRKNLFGDFAYDGK